MKYLFAALALLASMHAAAQWTALPSGTAQHLHKIAFRDAAVGYCVGGGEEYGGYASGTEGVILRTADGGTTWVKVVQDSTMVFNELAVNGDTVAAYGGTQIDPVIARSTDNGVSWTVTTNSLFVGWVKTFGGDTYFIDSTTINRSNSSGTAPVCPARELYDVNASGIFLVGSAIAGFQYFVAKSHDFGTTWDTSYISPNPFSPSPFTHAAIKAFGDTIIICATYPGTVAYSYNNGATWGAHLDNVPFLCFISSPRVITGTVGTNHVVRSIDGGQTFLAQDSMPHRISQFFFLNENTGYLCGRNGMIYKTTNGGGNPATGVSSTAGKERDIQLYPNPASARLTIRGDFENGSSLSLFNGAGQRMLSAPVAGQSTTIAVGSLPPGVYQIVVTEKGRPIATRPWVKQ